MSDIPKTSQAPAAPRVSRQSRLWGLQPTKALTCDFWQTTDALLNADGALLASYEQVRAAKEEHEAKSREAALAQAYAEAGAKAQELRATSTPAEA